MVTLHVCCLGALRWVRRLGGSPSLGLEAVRALPRVCGRGALGSSARGKRRCSWFLAVAELLGLKMPIAVQRPDTTTMGSVEGMINIGSSQWPSGRLTDFPTASAEAGLAAGCPWPLALTVCRRQLHNPGECVAMELPQPARPRRSQPRTPAPSAPCRDLGGNRSVGATVFQGALGTPE